MHDFKMGLCTQKDFKAYTKLMIYHWNGIFNLVFLKKCLLRE